MPENFNNERAIRLLRDQIQSLRREYQKDVDRLDAKTRAVLDELKVDTQKLRMQIAREVEEVRQEIIRIGGQ